eukprot:2133460-Rhodomonas_salina.1
MAYASPLWPTGCPVLMYRVYGATAYAHAARCPVLRARVFWYQVCFALRRVSTGEARLEEGSRLRACYAMSGTELGYGCWCLRECYAMSGTEMACCYAVFGTEITYGLRECYAVSGTEIAYGVRRR